MSLVVQSIVDTVHNSGGRFIDQNWKGVVSLTLRVPLALFQRQASFSLLTHFSSVHAFVF
jgi:hypothetical protein